MKKPILLLTMLLIIAAFLVACSDQDDAKGNTSNEAENLGDTTENEDEFTERKLSAEEISDIIIKTMIAEDMETVASYVHPEKGLLFSPYVFVEETAVVLDKTEVAELLENDEVYDWGNFDGSGEPIDLTGAQYFAEFLDMTPYEEPDDILVNDEQDRGNTINNVWEVFPDAEIIEYYYEGTEEYAGIDWSSVLFVYEENADGELTLIAIVRDMWTV